MESKSLQPKKIKAHSSASSQSPPLALAFDQCPVALFAWLTDAEAANVACALCLPQFLVRKRYEIKRSLRFRAVVAGLYPCVVRNVVGFDSHMLSLLPSTVRSMEMVERGEMRWQLGDLPKSLTHLGVSVSSRGQLPVTTRENWPPALTSLSLDASALPSLPSSLRVLVVSQELPLCDLPRSLTALKAGLLRSLSILYQLPHLTTLKMGLTEGAKPSELDSLPPSLTTLSMLLSSGNRSFQNAGIVKLPSRLRHLCLTRFPPRVFHSLPLSLEQFVFYDNTMPFDQPIRHSNLRTLKVSDNYDQPIHVQDLPSLQVLSVGSCFNHPLDDLPPSLSELTINGTNQSYDHSLDRLPTSIKRVTLHRCFTRPLDSLPPSLSYLRIHSRFDRSVDRLPHSLTELHLKDSFFNKPLSCLPDNLQALSLGPQFVHPLDSLPSSLNQLSFHFLSAFNRPLDRLPESLQVLHLPDNFNQRLPHLPPSLKVLSTGGFFNLPLHHLPDSLSRLTLGGRFNQPFLRLPRELTELRLGQLFDHPLPLVPSPSVEASGNVDYKGSSQMSEHVTYPTGLRALYLGRSFNQLLVLPPSLTILDIHPSGRFIHPLPIASLPKKLISLQLPFAHHRHYPEYEDLQAILRRCPFVQIVGTQK